MRSIVAPKSLTKTDGKRFTMRDHGPPLELHYGLKTAGLRFLSTILRSHLRFYWEVAACRWHAATSSRGIRMMLSDLEIVSDRFYTAHGARNPLNSGSVIGGSDGSGKLPHTSVGIALDLS